MVFIYEKFELAAIYLCIDRLHKNVPINKCSLTDSMSYQNFNHNSYLLYIKYLLYYLIKIDIF